MNTKHRMAIYLGSIQVIRLHIGWLVSLRLLGERNSCSHKAERNRRDGSKLKQNNGFSLHLFS